MRTSLSIVTLLVLLAACSRATSGPSQVNPGQSIQLAEGEYAQVNDSPVTLQFVRANDSRCPSDVVCVSAGEALITLAFNGAGAEKTDTLRIVKPKLASYGGYLFEASDLQPYPKSQGQIPGKTLTLRVSRPQ
jgi:hypothetical protein